MSLQSLQGLLGLGKGSLLSSSANRSTAGIISSPVGTIYGITQTEMMLVFIITDLGWREKKSKLPFIPELDGVSSRPVFVQSIGFLGIKPVTGSARGTIKSKGLLRGVLPMKNDGHLVSYLLHASFIRSVFICPALEGKHKLASYSYNNI